MATKPLTPKDEAIATMLFLGEHQKVIAKYAGVSKRAAEWWMTGDRRPELLARAEEMRAIFRQQNESKIMHAQSLALKVITEALVAERRVPKVSDAKAYENLPDHDIRLRAAAQLKQRLPGTDGAESEGSMMDDFHRCEEIDEIKLNGRNNGNGRCLAKPNPPAIP